ncbi:MAG: inositol monophosphatase [Candidatus Dadabacteria bacterium]|nr:inositol monophosphatase [Candidatus Dadabacteria bacterium]NIQ16240.1 inositol monophosphatase [Candidatus Dadabacteria bacterium]
MKYFKTIENIARLAGEIQVRNLGKHKSIKFKNAKGKNDIVTKVDTECEQIIISEIKKSFPDHDILAEEGGGLIDKSSPYKWLVDPLDGTMNYTHAYPYFCVSIALEYNGEIIYGLVYDPVKYEMFTAEKQKGAKINGKEIKVSKTKLLEKALVVSGTFFYEDNVLMDKHFDILKRVTKIARGVRRDGSAALDLCYVACGRFDGFWEYGLNPWDVAAGSFILKEAGGLITDFSSNHFNIYDKELVATNSKIHKELLSLIS